MLQDQRGKGEELLKASALMSRNIHMMFLSFLCHLTKLISYQFQFRRSTLSLRLTPICNSVYMFRSRLLDCTSTYELPRSLNLNFSAVNAGTAAWLLTCHDSAESFRCSHWRRGAISHYLTSPFQDVSADYKCICLWHENMKPAGGMLRPKWLPLRYIYYLDTFLVIRNDGHFPLTWVRKFSSNNQTGVEAGYLCWSMYVSLQEKLTQ